MTWYGLVFVVALGLSLGSFVNALEWRLRRQRHRRKADSEALDDDTTTGPLRTLADCGLGVLAELWDWLRSPLQLFKWPKGRAKRSDKYSIATGRSMCPQCKHELAARDLVPVASWLWLRGRCRYCRKPISWQYPLIELVTATIFGVSYAVWPLGYAEYGLVALGLWLVLVTGFVALGLYDAKWHYLPNEILYPLLWLMAVWLGLDAVFGAGSPRLVQAGLGLLVIGGLFFAIYCVGQLLHRPLIGYGDVRLGALLGLLVGGPIPALAVMFLASLLGTLCIVPLLVQGKADKSSQIPYGPFLLAAGIIVFLLADRLTIGLTELLLGPAAGL